MKKNILIINDEYSSLSTAIVELLAKENINTVNIIQAPASLEVLYPELSKFPEVIVPITNPYKDINMSYNTYPIQRSNRTPKKKKRK